jgi:transposase
MGKLFRAGRLLGSSLVPAWCGIDVSAATLEVAVQREDVAGFGRREFSNTRSGHRLLIQWLHRLEQPVQVVLEATGVYSLDVALALGSAERIMVSVINPKRANQFARTLGRSKTDKADAQALAEYSRRMPFVVWQPPSGAALALRALTRHMATLSEEHSRLENRLHAAQVSGASPSCVAQDLKRALAAIEKRQLKLRRIAEAMIAQDTELKWKHTRLLSIPGVGPISSLQLIGELAGLDPEMTVRQWVALSGLDPVHHRSGSSVSKPSRISRQGNAHLRHALFMPALVGVRSDPAMKAFYLQLQQRHKPKMQALIAVARKMLHAIYGIFKTNSDYDGAKLFPKLQTS